MIEDYSKENDLEFNWYVQSLSSCFGPIGMYQGYRDIKEENASLQAPKFLGIQQEAVCPFVERLGTVPENRNSKVPILEPTLFRSNPTPDLVEFVDSILKEFGGDVKAVLNSEYAAYEAVAISFFQNVGIDLSIQMSEDG